MERISRCNARIRGGIPLGHGGVAEVIVPFGLAKAGLFSGCPVVLGVVGFYIIYYKIFINQNNIMILYNTV